MTGREEEGEAEVAEGSKMSITLRVRAGGGTRLSTPLLLVGIAGRRGEEGPGMEEGYRVAGEDGERLVGPHLPHSTTPIVPPSPAALHRRRPPPQVRCGRWRVYLPSHEYFSTNSWVINSFPPSLRIKVSVCVSYIHSEYAVNTLAISLYRQRMRP